MRKSIPLLIVALFMLGGCAYISKEAVPTSLYTRADMQREGAQAGQVVTSTRYGVRLFTIPLTVPQPNEMVDELVRTNNAKGITDLDVEMSELFSPIMVAPANPWATVIGLIIQIPKVKVTGRVVQ
ncbi:MAG TPA: hypothetical protein PKW95_07640 [bacterium]|nr:hypothetical protein [bacterium]